MKQPKFIFPGAGGATSGSAVTAVLQPPVNGALTSTAGGALAAVTYFVKTTFVNSFGETLASTETSLAVALDKVLNVAPPSNAPLMATGWNVYVSTATGTETRQNGGTPIAIGTAWVEPTSGLVAGAALPGSNTALFGVATPGGPSYGASRLPLLITVTQNTWVDIRPNAKAASGAAMLVTPSTPIETYLGPGDTVSYLQDTTGGQISLVQIAG